MNSFISSISKATLLLLLFAANALHSQEVDSLDLYRINSIKISGNKKTRDNIILREMVKKQSDSLQLKHLPYILTRSEQNIFNTHLFIYDSIKPVIDHDNKTIDLTIKLKERWYIWPIPFVDYLDRDFNNWILNKDPKRLAPGVNIDMDNFTGNKDRLIVLLQAGYANEFGFLYQLPYFDKKQTLGAYVQYSYSEYNKLFYKTENNKQLFDVNDSVHLRNDNDAEFGFFYRPKLFIYHSFSASYSAIKISDQIVKLNPDYFYKGNDYTAFGSLSYRFNFDNRDNKIYPLKGYYFDVSLLKIGLNLSDNSPINNAQSYFTFKTYFPFTEKINLATHWRARITNTEQKIPFAFNRALGYSYFIRGYERYIIDGQNYYFTRNSLRFQLIKPKFHEVNALHKFKPFSTIPFYSYINFFFDGAYVKEDNYKETNSLVNSYQYGYGIGLDLISYYDLVFRIEYSRNKLNTGGIFFHFTSGF